MPSPSWTYICHQDQDHSLNLGLKDSNGHDVYSSNTQQQQQWQQQWWCQPNKIKPKFKSATSQASRPSPTTLRTNPPGIKWVWIHQSLLEGYQISTYQDKQQWTSFQGMRRGAVKRRGKDNGSWKRGEINGRSCSKRPETLWQGDQKFQFKTKQKTMTKIKTMVPWNHNTPSCSTNLVFGKIWINFGVFLGTMKYCNCISWSQWVSLIQKLSISPFFNRYPIFDIHWQPTSYLCPFLNPQHPHFLFSSSLTCTCPSARVYKTG